MTNEKTMLDQCLTDRGQGDKCVICSLHQSNQCSRVMSKMERLLVSLRTRDYRLDEIDRDEIIHETLYVVIARAEKALKGEWDIEDIGRLAGGIFSNKRADFYGKLARFGETTTVVLGHIPDGLDTVVSYYSSSLSLEEKRLSTGPGLSKSVYHELQKLSEEQRWQNSIQILYRNSWKGQLVALDDHAYNLVSNCTHPGQKEKDDGVAVSLNPYLFLWQKIGSQQAKSCRELFSSFGEIIFDESVSSRQEIADALQIKSNSLNQRIGRCYKLIQNFVIKQFEEMDGNESGYCKDLFFRLYAEKREKKSGVLQRIASVAEENGVTSADINTVIRRCRKLAMQRIGAHR